MGCPPGITVDGTRGIDSDQPDRPHGWDIPLRFARAHDFPPMLSAQELIDWVALSRGSPMGWSAICGEYPDGGAPMPQYLIPQLLFDVLLRVGLLTHRPT